MFLVLKTNEKLVPVNEETEIVNITGFVVKPEFSKKSNKEQFFFVNDQFYKEFLLKSCYILLHLKV